MTRAQFDAHFARTSNEANPVSCARVMRALNDMVFAAVAEYDASEPATAAVVNEWFAFAGEMTGAGAR